MHRSVEIKLEPGATAGMRPRFALVVTAFHFAILVYVWLRIQPALGYHRSGPWFFLREDFFRGYSNRPGGLIEYAAAVLAQFDFHNLTGALSFTALAGLTFLATAVVWRKITGRGAVMVAFVPPFLLLLTRQAQDGPTLTMGLGFLLALGLALAYSHLPWVQVWLRVTVAVLLAMLTSAVAGLWPGVLFLAVATLFEASLRRGWKVTCAVAVAGLVVTGAWLFDSGGDSTQLFNPWGNGMPLLLAILLFLFLPVTLLVRVCALGAAARRRPSLEKRRPIAGKCHHRRWFETPEVGRVAMASLFAAGAASVWLAFGDRAQTFAEIEFAARQRDERRLLTAATRLEPLSPAAEVRLHLALCRSGRLLSDLFSFTNQVAWELLPGVNAGAEATRAQAETLFELGQVNDAEHLAHEVLEYEGNRPDLLRLLADVNVLKDRPEAARVFLNVLCQSPVHQSWAASRLRDLEADPRLESDRELSLVRSRMVTTDLPHDGMPTATFLEQLLHSNPRNQMALEYLLVHRLLTLDLDRFAAKVGQLHDFGGTNLPRHCEEAVLLYDRLRGRETDLHGCQIRPETRQRFQALCRAVDSGAFRTPTGSRVLSREFGDTYWHFYLSRVPGGGSLSQ